MAFGENFNTGSLAAGTVVRSVSGSDSIRQSGIPNATASAKSVWMNATKCNWPAQCCAQDCTRPPVDGAHVKWNAKQFKWCIIPTCKTHNPGGSRKAFQVNSGTRWVHDERASLKNIDILIQGLFTKVTNGDDTYTINPITGDFELA